MPQGALSVPLKLTYTKIPLKLGAEEILTSSSPWPCSGIRRQGGEEGSKRAGQEALPCSVLRLTHLCLSAASSSLLGD